MTDLLRPETGELIDVQQPADLELLDSYSPTPIAAEEPRLDALATISAGFRQPGKEGHAGLPAVSRDGTIYLHDPSGRAPGLRRALEAGGGKSLTIAFPFNNPAAFCQQRFTDYSSTNLLAYGDEFSITLLDPKTGGRRVLEVGSDEYDRARARCKVSISIYFALAEWTAEGHRVVWHDGVGLYRLRTTSRNTLRNLRASLRHVAAFTNGQLAGVPFDIALDYRDVAGPDGARRNIPCWTFTLNPPGGLTSRTFAPMLRAALAEGRLLQVEPPRSENAAAAEADYLELGDDELPAEPLIETPSEPEVALLREGGRADARAAERSWFALVRGTALETNEARAAFIFDYSGGETSSLATYLEGCSEEGVALLLLTAGEFILAAKHQEEASAQAEEPDPSSGPATEAQKVALQRLLRPSRLQDVNWATLTMREAGDWIVSLQR